MKKFFSAALSLVLFGAAFVSCSDDDDNKQKPVNEVPYSELTTEKQKEKLSYDAVDLINEMKDLSETKGVGLLTTFVLLSDNLFADDAIPSLPDGGDNSEKNALSLKTALDLASVFGTHTWDFDTQSFVTTPSEDIVFIMPATVKSTENNGKIVVESDVKVTLEGDIILPTKAEIKLYVDEKEEGTINLSATYSNIPEFPLTAATATFKIDNYTLLLDAQADTKGVAIVKLTKGSKNLIDGNVNMEFELASLLEEDFLPSKGNATINILDNLQLKGNVDVNSILKAIYALDDELTEEQESVERVKIYNKNINVSLLARQEKNFEIAKVEILSKKTTSGNNTYYDEIIGLVFGDESPVEASVYFSEGFDDVIKAYNQLISWFAPNL